MKLARLLSGAAIALACAAFTPQSGSATSITDPGYDWCGKIGDYYDSAGTGYHIIYCFGEYAGQAWYYIPHGAPFTINMM